MIRLMCLAALAAFPAHAQTFEVASIKPRPPAVDKPLLKNPDVNPVHISGNRVTLEMVGLKDLVMAAFGVKEYQVSGVPAWASRLDSWYDIAAKAPGNAAPSMEQARLMLQSLLIERFQLKLRRESKQLPVYNLVVAKNGPKLKPAAGDRPPAPGMRRGSMDQLAALLSLMVDSPVIDQTGLAGVYEYSNSLTLLDSGAQDSADAIARALAAIQDQLGLRAQASRANIDLLIIESAGPPAAD